MDSYHDGECVLAHGLVVECLGCVQRSGSWVQAELAQAERVGAAQQCEGQFVLLILIGGAQPQNLCVGRHIFRHAHLIPRLGELRPVVVGVDHLDEDLEGGKRETF